MYSAVQSLQTTDRQHGSCMRLSEPSGEVHRGQESLDDLFPMVISIS